MFAVVNVHKPLGLTSHDVVARLRRVFGLKRVGHLGTLDPLAEGVLPVCLGQATRLIEYFPTDKRYRADVTFGKTTITLDREGEVLSEKPCPPLTPETLEPWLATLRGDIQQQVPLYSAVHVGGKKLYKLAREGKIDVELPTKPVTIHEFTLVELRDTDTPHPTAILDVHCSSGTYIRSLARDLGEQAGCGAYLSGLVRTAHGKFSLKDAVPLETLMESPDPTQYLQNPAQYLGMPVLELDEERSYSLLQHGMKLPPEPAMPKLKPNRFYFVRYQQTPVAVAQAVSGQLKPVKVFPPESK